MCGIAGIVEMGTPGYGVNGVDAEFLGRMCDLMKHRGPDDSAVYVNGGAGGGAVSAGLGHRRLSILDLSPAGRQPMSNEDGGAWIVFNGEIYNFQELRDALEKRGHVFKSRTDGEVILHLYEEMGDACVSQLRGMFAFALWDEKKEKLLLARDRVGKKPLYYFCGGGSFVFASEIKSILLHPRVGCEVDKSALHHYLTYGYTPSPGTMFKGIRKLPPAHILVYEKGAPRTQRYWRLKYDESLKGVGREELERRLMELLREAVKIRLISDVPLGAFLSGGVDSSAVVALMSEFMGKKPVKTFSIGFEDEDFSELKYAAIVSRLFSTEHHEFVVKPDAVEILPKLVRHYGEPFGDSSCIPSYYLSQMTRQHVTVALTGDGGDESFAGYERYKGVKVAGYFQALPAFVFKLGGRALAALQEKGIGGRGFSLKGKRRFLEAMAEERDYRRRYARWVSYFTNAQKDALYTEGFKRDLRRDGRDEDSFDIMTRVMESVDAVDAVDKALAADVETYLPEDLLVKMDVATMANSLEARSPFLDHKLMEFAASIPAAVKLEGLTSKAVLKGALKGKLPPEILHRKKMGFGVPLARWFRQELKGYVHEILLSEKALGRGYFREEAVRRLLEEHVSAAEDHGQRIWALLNLELWHRIYIDGQKAD